MNPVVIPFEAKRLSDVQGETCKPLRLVQGFATADVVGREVQRNVQMHARGMLRASPVDDQGFLQGLFLSLCVVATGKDICMDPKCGRYELVFVAEALAMRVQHFLTEL